MATSASAQADRADVRSVLELYTSQGCSSCPPADRLAVELARENGVLLLSFPVDYWDYLGWKDTLAHSSFSKRQRLYARARGDRQVYTPQIVINGMLHAVGSDREAITAGLIASGDVPYKLVLRQDGDGFAVDVPAAGGGVSAAVILLPVLKSRKVEIGRGENDGHQVTYVNVVRGLTKLGDWDGSARRFAIPADALGGEAGDADHFVVVLQAFDGKTIGPLLGAVRGPGW